MELGYTYWKDDGWFVGYLDDYPDYVTQGETHEEFEDMLRSLREDILAFDFSFVHHHGKLKIA
jgi:predicted RNase H-like HicB family nuclease